MEVHLESVDPEADRLRSYRLAIEPDLFADCALRVAWGRIGRPGRQRVAASGDRDSVRAEVRRLLARRRRHGYAVVPEGS